MVRVPLRLLGAWLGLVFLMITWNLPALFSWTPSIGLFSAFGTGYVLTIAALPGLDVYLFLSRRRRLLRLARIEAGEPVCAHCGYPTTHTDTPTTCPECGNIPTDVLALRKQLYGFARFAPGLEEIPSDRLANALYQAWRAENKAAWLRLPGFSIITIGTAIVLAVTNSVLEKFNILLPVFLKRGIIITLVLGFLGVLGIQRMKQLLSKARALCDHDASLTESTESPDPAA